MKQWFQKAGIRAIKTMAQSSTAMIGTAALLCEVDWKLVAGSALLSGVLSLLTSIAGIPELDGKKE